MKTVCSESLPEVEIPFVLYCFTTGIYELLCGGLGNTSKSNTQTITIIQKRAIRLINNAGYRDHTNALFIKMQAIKFQDLVTFKTAQIIYKVRNKMLPKEISKLFIEREGGYNLRGKWNLKIQSVRHTLKSMSNSIAGVKLWISLSEEIKESNNIKMFKIKYKKQILSKYKNKENRINPGR